MIGNGCNYKSIAYVKNLVQFIELQLDNDKGIHIYNYADKPDLTINHLVGIIRIKLGLPARMIRIPYFLALNISYIFDLMSLFSRKQPFTISSVRIKKFYQASTVSTAKIDSIEFYPKYKLEDGINQTIESEWLEQY